MTSYTFKAKVSEEGPDIVFLEFGSTQCNMDFSAKGMAARKLKLEEGDKVEVTIKKV